MFLEYEQPVRRGDAKSFTFGPLAQTEFGEIAGIGALHTLNLLFTRTVGNNSTETTEFNPRLAVAAADQSADSSPGSSITVRSTKSSTPASPPTSSTASGRFSSASKISRPMAS